MVEMCKEHLSGVTLVSNSTISMVSSIVIEMIILDLMEAPSVNKGGASSSVDVPASAS